MKKLVIILVLLALATSVFASDWVNNRYVAIRNTEGTILMVVDLERIIAIEANSAYLYLYTIDAKGSYLIAMRNAAQEMSQLLEMLNSYNNAKNKKP